MKMKDFLGANEEFTIKFSKLKIRDSICQIKTIATFNRLEHKRKIEENVC